MDMLAALLFSAFAVYGFFSLLLALTERCSDAAAVRVGEHEELKRLFARCATVAKGGREIVILLDDKAYREENFSLGYAVYLRVSEGKGDRDGGDDQKRA
jgi:hypothetical protein